MKRYNITTSDPDGIYYYENELGKWVFIEDVEGIVAQRDELAQHLRNFIGDIASLKLLGAINLAASEELEPTFEAACNYLKSLNE